MRLSSRMFSLSLPPASFGSPAQFWQFNLLRRSFIRSLHSRYSHDSPFRQRVRDMTRFRPILRLATCLFLFAGITGVACGSYAAFTYQPLGTQLIVLDSAGRLTYSLCNSNATPVYPTGSPLVLPAAVQPKSGSNIAAVGWYEDGEVYVCLA